MSLLSSLNTGTAGLEANTLELSVIGDNIANANTVGFKSSRADFQDALAETVVGQNTSQVGMGTRLESVQRLTTQGSLSTTSRATDLAIDGQGMFVVKGSYNGRDATYYTRAGQFSLDKDGYLTNLTGLRVQGYAANSAGTLGKTVGDLPVGAATSAPLATTTLTTKANLKADDAVIAAAWDPTNPSGTSNYSTSMAVYDSLGSAHQVDVYYRKTATGAWDWHAMADGGGLTGGTAGTPTEIAAGALTFGTNGSLTAATTTTNNFLPLGATSPQALTFNFGTGTGAGGSGLDGVTQFAADKSASSFLGQDGYPSGDLANMSVDSKGQLVGNFSNGRSRVLGQVAVANVQADDKMDRVGGNLFTTNLQSGEPVVGAPGSGGHGSVISGSLEQSNVDMAEEFVRMIAAQRGFQANAKTVTTADQLLQELMGIKR